MNIYFFLHRRRPKLLIDWPLEENIHKPKKFMTFQKRRVVSMYVGMRAYLLFAYLIHIHNLFIQIKVKLSLPSSSSSFFFFVFFCSECGEREEACLYLSFSLDLFVFLFL